MIKLREVHKVYTQGKQGFHALKNIELYFEKGEFITVFGPSGCGKTTLLNILGGLDSPTSGEMVIGDRLTTNFLEKEWDYFRNHRIGFIFQQYNLIEHLPIVENVALGLKIGGENHHHAKTKAVELLRTVGLEKHLHKLPGELSGGERQRVAIARALINDPDIILADEPTGALDNKTGFEIMDLIQSISKDKLVIVVTHNRKLAEKYSTRIIELQDGRVSKDTAPKDKKVSISLKRPKIRKKLSFKEAIRLAYYNIKGKIWRTLLVALGLSIGIIGLVLIDSFFSSMRNGLEQQGAVLENNPDLLVMMEYDESFDYQTEKSAIEAYGHFKEVLYAPTNTITITKNITDDAMLNDTVSGYAIENPKTQEIIETFTTLIGDSRLPQNDNEMTLPLSVAKRLVSDNLNLTDEEIWDQIKGKEYQIYSEYYYFFGDNRIYDLLDEGSCIITDLWNGDITNLPDGYDVVTFGDIFENTLARAKYHPNPIMVTIDKELYCQNYDALSWAINTEDPIQPGQQVTVVGIHDNKLFGEIIFSDNVITAMEFQHTYYEEGEPYSYYYNTSHQFRAFLKPEKVEDKATIIINMEASTDYLITEYYGVNDMDILGQFATFFMYILQFIFSAIITIAILTGGLMLLLILFISIIERKREIGLIRAMGGTRGDVRIIYSGETTMIGLIAGLFSVIISIVLVFVLNGYIYNNHLDLVIEYLPFVDPQKVLVINPTTMVLAVIGSIVIALISGLIPSVRAGRKKPIEALRNE